MTNEENKNSCIFGQFSSLGFFEPNNFLFLAYFKILFFKILLGWAQTFTSQNMTRMVPAHTFRFWGFCVIKLTCFFFIYCKSKGGAINKKIKFWYLKRAIFSLFKFDHFYFPKPPRKQEKIYAQENTLQFCFFFWGKETKPN